jgi:hypothetical protein
MKSTATVFAISGFATVVAARTGRGGPCTIFELCGTSTVDIGDIVEGDLATHGPQMYHNLTKATAVNVYVLAVDASTSVVRAMMQ